MTDDTFDKLSASLQTRAINTLRFLSADAVQQANSGHPGLPMGAAAMGFTLWTRHLRHNPRNPQWTGRDRFILSGGHGSMLLYSLLHLTGYDVSLDELENFRQWGSITPGHPESGLTPGVEMTTGPLGQGFASGVPWNNLKELLDYAKANPGKIKYSTSGAGSFHHLVMEAFSRQEGVKWVHIPYKSGHEATTAILGGHVEVEACSSEWKPYVDSGKLRLLATYNPMRLPKYPDVPTWVELGYNISASSLLGVVGPKGLPRPVVDKLHDAFKQAVDDPAFKKTMDSFDMPIIYRDPDGLLKDIKEIADRWGKLITDLGIRQE